MQFLQLSNKSDFKIRGFTETVNFVRTDHCMRTFLFVSSSIVVPPALGDPVCTFHLIGHESAASTHPGECGLQKDLAVL